MGRIFSFLRLFRRDIIIMMLALRKRDTPKSVKYLMLAAALYFLSPIDIVPDSIPFLGLVDDAVIVPAAVMGLLNLLPSYVRRESEEEADYLIRHLRLLLIVATLVVLAWIALILFILYKLFS